MVPLRCAGRLRPAFCVCIVSHRAHASAATEVALTDRATAFAVRGKDSEAAPERIGMGKRWRIRPYDAGRVRQMEQMAAVPSVVAQLLLNRGIENPADVQSFLEARFSTLRSPGDLPGLTAAADHIHRALDSGARIAVYGDYDADGMTATAILLRCLRALGGKPEYYIPNRLEEGYGLNAAALRKMADDGVQMVITVDCGIASCDEAAVAQELGLALIVTDHHEFGPSLPPAAAIVHPRLPGHTYPFDGLCGAAVAFKLAWALCQRASNAQRVAPRLKALLLESVALAAIGTVADVVPLVDENRLIVRHGLHQLKNEGLVGIGALLAICRLQDKPELTSEDIAFSLAPRLNAAGRLGQAELAVELLTTDDRSRARGLAEYLNELNASRTSLERSIYTAARQQIKEACDEQRDAAFVLSGRGWHPGVIGIVAGRIADKFSRPCVMIALDQLGSPLGTGSARSAWGLNLHRTLADCAEHLETYGGHAAAAGLRIDESHIEAFRNRFRQRVAEQVKEEDRIAEIDIDAEAPLPQLTLRTVRQIEQLAPFGERNPRPILCATSVEIDGPVRRMGEGDRHLNLKLKHKNVSLRAIAFGQAEWAEDLDGQSRGIDIAYRPVINEFRGMRKVELHLVDWRPTTASGGDSESPVTG